jgi:hypothetical protein
VGHYNNCFSNPHTHLISASEPQPLIQASLL